jgi:hypothetical protein
MGSKKCMKTEYKLFNQKEFDFFDKVKGMEDGYKLADPASMTLHANYVLLGPFGVIDWVNRSTLN